MSNVEAGDLAVYVRNGDGVEENVGRFFNVIDSAGVIDGEISWRVKPLGTAYSPTHHRFVSHEGEVMDRYLRPIRDPGDDAADETLVFAGKPKSDTAPMVTREAA
jgi:hypothetical protein